MWRGKISSCKMNSLPTPGPGSRPSAPTLMSEALLAMLGAHSSRCVRSDAMLPYTEPGIGVRYVQRCCQGLRREELDVILSQLVPP